MATYVAGEKPAGMAKRKSSKKMLDHMRIHHAENGGHIVEHHFTSGMGAFHEPERHVFAGHEGGKLLDHVAHHMGVTDNEEEGESPAYEKKEKESAE